MAGHTTAEVHLRGHFVGAVAWLPERDYALFEFDPAFRESGLDIAPIQMPLSRTTAPIGFPGLGRETYLGLPGLLADVLPDKFGNAVIDAWLARQGRDATEFNPVERLCYVGGRGMGALEFKPALRGTAKMDAAAGIEVAALVGLAQQITRERLGLETTLTGNATKDTAAILDIIRVGTSAGGARPKAVIAMDQHGNIRSGQADAPDGYDHWLLKLDGVDDLELGRPGHYGRIEYAYHHMARAASIQMTECQLLEEGGRAHFLTRRFDREPGGRKVHLQSLCGIAHLDFNLAGAHSYEQAFAVMRELRLSRAETEQQFRRAVFNVVARNQDDHTKNIAFLMDAEGRWRLSPAFDVTYAHNPKGHWTNRHQMTLGGKRDGFVRADLIELGQAISLPRPERVVEAVIETVQRWPDFAAMAHLPTKKRKEIHRNLRLDL